MGTSDVEGPVAAAAGPSAASTTPRRWALLVRPSANRVYDADAPGLLAAELGVLDRCVLGGVLEDLAVREVGGIPYLTWSAPAPDAGLLAHVARLSAAYALFEVTGGDDVPLLAPVALPPAHVLDDDLVTIPKYTGKTNETFTALLLNVTLWASAAGPRSHRGGLRVLDPMSGRGTTLSTALLRGHHAAGIEVDGKDVDAQVAFVKTWLRRKRLKHTADVVPLRRGGRAVGRRLDVELALDKDAWKAGDRLTLRVCHADTLLAADLYADRSFDAVVTDAPYGVQHGSHARGGALHRSPLELVREALPGWLRLLRPGGAVGIAWNTHVAPREELVGVLAAAGLEPLDDGPWRALRHRVDQAIQRDVVVARLPGTAPGPSGPDLDAHPPHP